MAGSIDKRRGDASVIVEPRKLFAAAFCGAGKLNRADAFKKSAQVKPSEFTVSAQFLAPTRGTA